MQLIAFRTLVASLTDRNCSNIRRNTGALDTGAIL